METWLELLKNLPLNAKERFLAKRFSLESNSRLFLGIAEIFAANLSEKELRLLIDFYSSRGLPPMDIETFKNTIAKANQIEQSSIEYIFNNSDSCVERDARLINNFLAMQNRHH